MRPMCKSVSWATGRAIVAGFLLAGGGPGSGQAVPQPNQILTVHVEHSAVSARSAQTMVPSRPIPVSSLTRQVLPADGTKVALARPTPEQVGCTRCGEHLSVVENVAGLLPPGKRPDPRLVQHVEPKGNRKYPQPSPIQNQHLGTK